jgi:outer membrane receptor protein involved in Fe transport
VALSSFPISITVKAGPSFSQTTKAIAFHSRLQVTYGTFGYTTTGSAVGNYTGVDFADFLLGIPNATEYDTVQQDNDGRTIHYHFFAQDQWKVFDRLTLTYGIRYELHPGYTDAGGDIGNFDPSVPLSGRVIYPDGKASLLAQNYLASANACNPDGLHNTNSAVINGAPCMPVETASQAGFPGGLKHYPKLRFMPRFGFAFRPFNNDRTAIRGGYGIYNITLLGSNFYSLTGTLQAATTAYVNTYNPATHAIGYQWPFHLCGSSLRKQQQKLWAKRLRDRQQHQLERSLHAAVVAQC